MNNKLIKIVRFFRKDTGLFYHAVKPAKYGDIVMLEDDFHDYDAFGVLSKRGNKLVIDMGHKWFEITEEVKENIIGGVERFYFYGISFKPQKWSEI